MEMIIATHTIKQTIRPPTHLQDVAFWSNNKRLSPSLNTKYLLHCCTAATLSISNQKKGVRAQKIHQEAIQSVNCPKKALINRVKYFRNHTTNPETILGT